MKFSTRSIERYTAAAIIPYFLLALVLLTAVLIAQQSSRFAEIVGQVQAPFALILAIIVNIAPSLLLFTIPMSVLAGTLIGFSRMGSDSELIAMRAAGVGDARLLFAPVMIGIVCAILTFYIAIVHTPFAARQLRDATLRAAQDRLKSPIQPGAFATDIGDKVIYVRSGDQARGVWQGVFIFSQDANGRALLVTAEDGRLDSSQDVAELVLRDANAITFNLPATTTSSDAKVATDNVFDNPKTPAVGLETRKGRIDNGGISNGTGEKPQFISERSGQLRIKLEDKLGTLVESLRTRTPELDELPWDKLSAATTDHAATQQQRRAAQIVQHKKLSLGFASLCFALLGAIIGLRVKRGGRGVGVLLSLALMIVYYLLALSGEQLARASTLPVIAGVWGATLITLIFALVYLVAPRLTIRRKLTNKGHVENRFVDLADRQGKPFAQADSLSSPSARLGISTLLFGLLDRKLFGSLIANFLFTLVALASVFLIFTLFELWRYIAANNIEWQIVAQYMLYLTPFVYSTLAAASLLVAVIFTYALLARRSEAVAWLACGQSVYRLFLPSLSLAILVGFGVWMVGESVLPYTNRKQDVLRARIRGGAPSYITSGGRQWSVSFDNRYIISYKARRVGQLGEWHSEIDARQSADSAQILLDSPLIFTLSDSSIHVAEIITGSYAEWSNDGLILSDSNSAAVGKSFTRRGEGQDVNFIPLKIDSQPLQASQVKLTHFTSHELETILARAKRSGDLPAQRKAQLAIQKRAAASVAPLVMVLLAMPLAIAFGRRSALVSLCIAILVGILFWGVSSGIDILGTYGLMPIPLAAWGSSMVFGVAGFYLLTRTRT